MQYSTTEGSQYPPVDTIEVRGHKNALAALLRWALLAQALHLTAIVYLQAMTAPLQYKDSQSAKTMGRQPVCEDNGETASLHSCPRQPLMHQQLAQTGSALLWPHKVQQGCANGHRLEMSGHSKQGFAMRATQSRC